MGSPCSVAYHFLGVPRSRPLCTRFWRSTNQMKARWMPVLTTLSRAKTDSYRKSYGRKHLFLGRQPLHRQYIVYST